MKRLVLALLLSAPSLAAAQQPPAPPADAPLTRAEAIARADAQFARADTDHDGTLTSAERAAAMPPRPDRAGPDRAGSAAPITAAEYRDRALRRFDRADTNHDGRLDPAERQAQRDAMRERRERMHGDTPPPAPPAH